MLRERRRHANFKPNRKLDPKSSRSTIYENEELRLRTININAEVERGQSDIKKLRKENDQLRREIWALRDEYDRLDKLLQASRNGRNILNQLNNPQLDDGPRCDSCNQSEESNCSSCCDTCDEDDDEPLQPATFEKFPMKVKEKLHVNFDHLSIVSEETLTGSCENPSSPNFAENTIDPIKEESEYKPDACSALIDFQSIVPPLAYFENLCYEDIGPNLDASGEIQYTSEPIQPRVVVTQPNKTTAQIGWDFSGSSRSLLTVDAEQFDRKGPDVFVQNGIQQSSEPIYAEVIKKPKNIFQVGGNLDDLLQNIEHLSQDIVQMQRENQKITTKYNLVNCVSDKVVEIPPDSTGSIIQQQSKPYRSEVNLMLCFDGTNPKIIPAENDGTDETTLLTPKKADTPPPYVPKPMNLLPTTLPYIASDTAPTIPTSDTKCFERFTETKDCNYLESIRRKIFPKKTNALKDKLIDDKTKLNNGTDAEKTSGNQVSKNTVNGTDVADTKRKARRVSLFNGKKNETTTTTTVQNQCSKSDLSPQQNRSKRHHHKVRRRHSDGNLRSLRGSHESVALGRCSSRESSVSLRSQKAQKTCKSSKTKSSSSNSNSNASTANVGKIPWFGCWGNDCMY